DSRASERAGGHLLSKLVAFKPKEYRCFGVILFCIAVTARFFWHAACILDCWRRSAECRLLVLVASTSKAKENHHVVLGFGLFCRRAIGRRIWLFWSGGWGGGDRQDSVLRVSCFVHCQLADRNATQRHDLEVDR